MEETHSTLQFANRASRIKVSVNPYRDVSQAMSLSDARRQINILRSKLQEYQQQQNDHRSLTNAPPLSSKASAQLALALAMGSGSAGVDSAVPTHADALLPSSSEPSLSPDLEWRKQTGDPPRAVCDMYPLTTPPTNTHSLTHSPHSITYSFNHTSTHLTPHRPPL